MQYKIVTCESFADDDCVEEAERSLNHLGADGWCVIAFKVAGAIGVWTLEKKLVQAKKALVKKAAKKRR